MTGINSGWVLAGGVRTHYSWAGTDGPAVVLLHGGGPGSSGWAGWRHTMGPLADAGYRVLAPDQLSMGRTDAREHAWPVNGHQSLVEHIADFVDALCLDTVHLAGNSQGAYVAAKFALDHPERADRLVLIGTATVAEAMGLPWPRKETNPGLLALRDYDYTRPAMRRFLEAIVDDPGKVTDEVVDLRHEMANLPGIRESRAAFDAYRLRMQDSPKLAGRFSLAASLPAAGFPLRLVWGAKDRFAPIEMGEELAARLDLDLTVLDAGHQAQTDQPELVNRILTDHFK